MAGGGKGGSQTTEVKIDPRLEEGAVQTLAAALRSASLPFRANRGYTQAAFSPQQLAAFQGADEAASAFGLPSGGAGGGVMDYLPAPEQTEGGFYAYSPSTQFDENVRRSLSQEDVTARSKLLDSYERAAGRIVKDPQFSTARAASVNAGPNPGGYDTNLDVPVYQQLENERAQEDYRTRLMRENEQRRYLMTGNEPNSALNSAKERSFASATSGAGSSGGK